MDVSDTQGDETISLSDVLVARDSCLPEDELWALCRECCLVLEVVNNSPDMFQTLCVTPDTVAFDQVGNVCFLDLDVDPDQIYLAPEHSSNGNGYKAHLFSLGMTLLYAAEYNVDHTQDNISQELRDLLGRMTADNALTRPDLESTIILCEEQLCGQSSQEVCCGIAAVAGFGLPSEESFAEATSYVGDISPDASHADSFMNSDQNDETCCDDIPDLTEDISQVESLPTSDQGNISLSDQGEIIVTETLDESLPHSEEVDMENRRRRRVSPQDGKSSWGFSEGKPIENGLSTEKKHKPALPKKPQLSQNGTKENEMNSTTKSASGELIVTELTSETDSEKSQLDMLKNNNMTNSVGGVSGEVNEKGPGRKNVSGSNSKDNCKSKELLKDKNQNITFLTYEEKTDAEKQTQGVDTAAKPQPKVGSKVGAVGVDTKDKPEVVPDSGASKSRRNKRKQGMTITEILDALDRTLNEEELWALCKEGTAALQRKKKHLPAYLSPDTLLIRESGNVSFKAIPEEKPLEVIFMAPELQSKGELSEKTCLYGLSVTLRCAAGKKYAPVSAMAVTSELKDLLQFLSDSNPAKRPELVDIGKVCNENSNSRSSDDVCAKLFQDAFLALTLREEKAQVEKTIAPKEAVVPPVGTPSAFKPMGGSTFQPIKPAPIGAAGGAFCPIPKKREQPKETDTLEPRIPSAFSSPSTHFKPIILQQSSSTTNEKPASIKEESSSSKDESKQAKSKPAPSTPQKKSSPDSDKEVVKKLKELKKNLMKHTKQPNMAKEIESEDKPSDSSVVEKTPGKKSLPSTPKKSGSSKNSERSGRRKSSGGGALDALLKEIQKQGNLPDTQSLASAIAQHLQSHLNPESSENSDQKCEPKQQPTGDLDMTVTSAQATLDQGQMLQNIPPQYHSQLLGQTMTFPNVQYGGNIMAGLPQFQFQQDPVTGFLQLVPVNVPIRPQSVHSNSGSVHSNSGRDITSPSGSGGLIKDGQSPQLSPRTAHNQSDVSNASAISDPTGLKPKSQHGRSAKGLVQKTANMRAKNLGRPSPSNMLNVPKDQGMYKWKSDHALDQTQPESSLSVRPGYVYDDSMLNVGNYRHPQFSGMMRPPVGPSAFGSPPHRHKTHSNSSSPSPSKDSGVSGMYNGAYRTMPQGSDASLMERLLSNENIKQREVLGKIIHLLRDEFAFDGYMENGVEDVAMAEYIASLGFLKWETFKSAICEKYSDLYWGSDLLCNLYNAVNGSRPSSTSRNVQQNARRSADMTRIRQRVNDDDSSGMSEPGDTSSIRRREREQLPPFPGHSSRPQSAHITNVNKQPETSDSTDSERYAGKRRRPRRKHELDKIKSSSSGNLITVDVTGSQRKIALEEADTVQIPAPVSLPQTTTVQTVVNKPPSGSQQNLNTTNSALPNSSSSSPNTRPVNANIPLKPASNSNANHLSVNGIANQQGQSQGQRLQREVSLSSHSSSQSDLARDGEVVAMEKKGHVVYHWTMIQMSMSTEMERFMQDIDEENHKMLLTKLSALEQQIKMEKRMRRKTQKFYKNLIENSKNNPPVKGDKNAKSDRNQIEQVASDITEMTQRIFFIDLCKTHIQMLLAELQGIDVSYLYSIAVCLSGEPLQLHPKPDNPLLQFQNIREPHSGLEIQALHAGTPDGLMAYLFASTALSEGYIHQFMFCFRYFATSHDVLTFLIDRYISATKVLTLKQRKRAGSTETNILRLQQRVIDLLHFWLEGYYSIDFQGKPSLVSLLRKFIRENVKEDSDGGKSLLALLSNCSAGNNLELSSADPDESEMHFWQQVQPKVKPTQPEKKTEWESFKSLVRGKSNAKSKVKISAVVVERRRHSGGSQEHLSSLKHMRRSDTFLLSDYTVQCLAEQLCLIEQGIFQLTHPVHYLNSKSQGVGVALTMKGMRTPAPTRRNEGSESSGLFLECLHDCSAIQRMIDHAQEVSHWVAGEIVGCSNHKVQLTILSKFLLIAQTCVQLRNFATSMAILDGLENLIVKQLPAWKNLHSKCAAIMEELNSTRMFLKNDPLSLMQQGKDCHLYPTIPSAVLFLLHIQQLEIGGFKLANQMYKWGKIRSIAQVIDQVRIFREHMYGFESNDGLQDILRNRIHDLSTQDIHTLAEQHDINYHKLSTGSGISGALKKMKGKLSAK